MALVTWPLDHGVKDAACVRCVFDFAGVLAAQSAQWQKRFGQVPEFRAVLHCGSVVTAEIGLERHKIAYFGDVVNTTGRLESLSKALDELILVSADLLDSLGALPPNVFAKNLGFHAIRGRNEPLQVSALRSGGSRSGTVGHPNPLTSPANGARFVFKTIDAVKGAIYLWRQCFERKI